MRYVNISTGFGRSGSSVRLRITPSAPRYSLTGRCQVIASIVHSPRVKPRRIGLAASASPSPGSSSTSALGADNRGLISDGDWDDDFVRARCEIELRRSSQRPIVIV